MNESITNELRRRLSYDCYNRFSEVWYIADRIDERYDALKADNADLQAKLDASILPPVDADGVPWTDDDVDKPFLWANDAERKTLREIAITWQGRNWCLVDDHDTHYPADKCRHVNPEPPDSQERIDADAKKWTCEYFDHPTGQCDDCPMRSDSTSCRELAALDLLRRQRELDGQVGE